MEPTTHYRTCKSLWYALWVPAALLWAATLLGLVPRDYRGLVLYWLLLGFFGGLFLPRIIPARCPSCGARRAYPFRERVAADSRAVKYRCRACGHVQDTGQVEEPGGE
ncbi:hypothetical protein P12x_006135 (plasmid) [Tundrisphaera lichenicola]|uniref:hypothetical protein n=1 Tax=Tundrisphaera lichenicola TaxID=2029860 RepID=UPI003EBD2A3E